MSIKRYNSLLTKAAIKLRRERPVVPNDFRWAKWTEDDYAYIYFRTKGCGYSIKGECTICDYWICQPASANEMVKACADALDSLESSPKVLQITALGSMFDEKEVPPAARKEIWKLAAASGAGVYACETRPETVSPQILKEMSDILWHMNPGIEMGLESASPWVQRFSLNKSSLGCFEEAVRTAKEHDIQTFANVLLGAPFLSERETIDDAVASMKWAFSIGTNYCVLFPVHVKPWTLAHWLWERNEYQCPSLWSLTETLRLLGADLASRTFIAWYRPQYSEIDRRYGKYSASVPTTCPVCESEVLRMLDLYRKNEDYHVVERLSSFSCKCREQWRNSIDARQAEDRRERAARLYEFIGNELLACDDWNAIREKEIAAIFEIQDESSKPHADNE